MTNAQIEKRLTDLVHHEPFIPFVVELLDGKELIVPHPPAFDETGAVFFGIDGTLNDFEFTNVRSIRCKNTEAMV